MIAACRTRHLGRAGLAAHVIARNIGLLAGAVGHDIAQQIAHLVAGFGLDHLRAARVARPCLTKVGVMLPPAIDDRRGGGDEAKRADRNALAEADGGGFDRAPIGRDKAGGRVPAIRCRAA